MNARISARQLATHLAIFIGGVIAAKLAPAIWQSVSTSEADTERFVGLADTLTNIVSTILQPWVMGILGVVILGSLAAIVFLKRDVLALSSSTTSMRSPRIEASSWKTELELEEIMRLVASYRGENERYSDAIQSQNDVLSEATKPNQIRKVVETLIEENQKFQRTTQTLDASLSESKDQLASLRADLSEARQESLQDQLTAIGNRRLFDLALEEEISKAQKTRSELSLIMTDIDHFKSFNDEYGHQMGDEVLATVANIMKTNIKGRDIVARYGGEEFAIILPETSGGNACTVANHIRTKIAKQDFKHHKTGEKIRKVTSSFGIAAYRPGEDPETLINRADAKLYDAKKTGRNRVLVDAAELRQPARLEAAE